MGTVPAGIAAFDPRIIKMFTFGGSCLSDMPSSRPLTASRGAVARNKRVWPFLFDLPSSPLEDLEVAAGAGFWTNSSHMTHACSGVCRRTKGTKKPHELHKHSARVHTCDALITFPGPTRCTACALCTLTAKATDRPVWCLNLIWNGKQTKLDLSRFGVFFFVF